MAQFHCRITEAIPHNMDPEIRADHLARHGAYLRQLREAGVLRQLWRSAGTRVDLAVVEVADPGELHEVWSQAPLFRYLNIEITALVEHPDLQA